MPLFFVGLGSNVGDRLENLRRSITLLKKSADITLSGISNVYETGPVGFKEQPFFLNAVVKIQTSLTPLEMLVYLKEIEIKIGRVERTRWGPREIDLDILAIEDVYFNAPQLVVPHPQMQIRKFVLKPFCDVGPTFKVFGAEENIRETMTKVTDQSKIIFFMSHDALDKKPKRFNCA